MSKARTEAFSDGVFAVAATLLVFTLRVPDVHGNLGSTLLNEWPSYATYAVSFGTILVIWVNHHTVLDSMERFDKALLFLNGFLLLTVAAIPFPTNVLAAYLQAGHDENAAAAAYGVAMSLMAASFTLMNLYARRQGLRSGPFNVISFSAGQLLYPLGALVSLASARAALLIYGATLVFYIALPLYREARARQQSASGGADLAHRAPAAAEPGGGDLRQDS